jgi:hypothetical protein
MHRLVAPVLLLVACEATVPDELVEPIDEPDPDPFVLADAIDTQRMVGHLEALQQIAQQNEGTRRFLSSGYFDSIDYVTQVVEGAGFTTTIDSYDILRFRAGDASAEVGARAEAAGELLVSVFRYSGAGEVEADVVSVDLMLPPGEANSSTSGCEPGDFRGFPRGAIALIQRGGCTFVFMRSNHCQ